MQNKRISYLVFSIFISNLIFIIYLIQIYNPNNYFSEFLISRGFTESNFKLIFILPLVTIPWLHTNFKEKVINEYEIYLWLTLTLSILFIPVSILSGYFPSFLVLTIYFISYYALIYNLFNYASWRFSKKMEQDQFNLKNQTFPQTENKIETDKSVNISYKYFYNGVWKKGWVNIVNVFASIWVYGIMGSGKSFTWFLQVIHQLLNKNFSMAIYDFKYPGLTIDVYKMYKEKKNRSQSFYFLYLNDIRYSHKCNPIEPKYIPTMQDIETISRILIRGSGDSEERFDPFFDGSAQGILTATIAILKKWQYKYNLEICSIPHAIIFASVKIEYILPLLLSEKEILMQVTSLREAFAKEDAAAQLAGQTASLSNRLRGLYSNEIMYIMSGKSDFDLRLNSKSDPKIVCIGSEQKKAIAMAPIISAFFEIISRETNIEEKEKAPFMMFLDEFARLTFPSLSEYLTTGRSNMCGIMGGTQGIPQIEERYKQAVAKAITDVQGTIIAGQCGNETAKYMADRLGKTNQQKTSITETMDSYSVNYTTDKDYLIPPSRFATMGTGEFAGIVVDDIQNVIEQKRFMGKMDVDPELNKILSEKIDLPLINSFDNANTKKAYELRKGEIEDNNLIFEFYNILEGLDILDVSDIEDNLIHFYIKFLKFDNEELRIFKNEILDIHEKLTIKNVEKAIFARLQEVIEQNEIQNFLNKYLDKLYKDIENVIKAEYKIVTGEDIEEDLFNVTNNLDYIVNDDTF